MTACRRYGVLFCNSFLVFGIYYFMELPISLQSEIMNSYHSDIGSNNSNQTDCKVCLGLGEVRYNVLFSVFRWTLVVMCLPSGFLIDKLGNGRSAILFSILPLIGAILYTVGAMSNVPVSTPMYLLMMMGNVLVSFGDGALRFVQARVVAHSFPESSLVSNAFSSLGYSGQALTLYTAPSMATVVGLIPTLWIGTAVCGLGVLCAVWLLFLLRVETPQIEDVHNNKMLTLKEFLSLPGTYWLYILAVGLTNACWLVKQSNVPEYLQLRHGYTMTEASYITGISPLVLLLGPFLCSVLKKIECDGIMLVFFQAWMVPLYALMGFYPDANVIIISLADGIGITMNAAMMWQMLVVLSPASYVGTLGGVMYLFGNILTALTYIASGYILKRKKEVDVDEALHSYQNFFLMLVIMSSTGMICGALMNVLDGRKACVLNPRIAKWRKSNMETIGLISMMEPSSRYSGIDDVNDKTRNDDDPSSRYSGIDDINGNTVNDDDQSSRYTGIDDVNDKTMKDDDSSSRYSGIDDVNDKTRNDDYPSSRYSGIDDVNDKTRNDDDPSSRYSGIDEVNDKTMNDDDPSSRYSGIDDVIDKTISDDPSVKSTTYEMDS